LTSEQASYIWDFIRKDKMKIKEATKIIISLSKPDKMPGYALGCQRGNAKQARSLRRFQALFAAAVML